MAGKRKWVRPKSEEELNSREAAGLWRAIGLVSDIAQKEQKITLEVICSIHKTIFEDAEPEIAGKFRKAGQDVNKLKCICPPPGDKVHNYLYAFWRDFDYKISQIHKRPQNLKSKSKYKKWFSEVLDLAVWTQHQFVAIHPFPQGNGRTSRLLTNLILQRFDIKPTQVKYEGEAKDAYLDALCRADDYNDYRPLKAIIYKGILEVYQKEKKLRVKMGLLKNRKVHKK